MYVMIGSRPDLSYSISYFRQFQNCFSLEHCKYLKGVLKYLKATELYGLKYERSASQTENIITGFVDADFGNKIIYNIDDRKSIWNYVI